MRTPVAEPRSLKISAAMARMRQTLDSTRRPSGRGFHVPKGLATNRDTGFQVMWDRAFVTPRSGGDHSDDLHRYA
jgi:hypothetical protein